MCLNKSRYKKSSYHAHEQHNSQQGNMIVMAIFVIVVISLLAGALIKIISASSNTTIHQVYGVRAKQAAQTGIQALLNSSFANDGTATACNTAITSPVSLTSVKGLTTCEFEASCVTEQISFAGEDSLYFKLSSTGTCTLNDHIVSRTVAVDAVQSANP